MFIQIKENRFKTTNHYDKPVACNLQNEMSNNAEQKKSDDAVIKQSPKKIKTSNTEIFNNNTNV